MSGDVSMADVPVTFRVTGEVEYESEACMYVVGSCPQLGEWSSQRAVQLHRTEEKTVDVDGWVWEGTVYLPKDATICYRFFCGKMTNVLTAVATDKTDKIEVILWETNIQPRKIITTDADDVEVPVAEFGSYDGSHTVSQGWLQNQTYVQVRFYNNPIFMWKAKYRSEVFSIKCSPVDYEPGLVGQSTADSSDEVSADGPMPCDKTTLTYYNLNEEKLRSSHQPQTGCVYRQDDFLVFMARAFQQKQLGFQMDFYVHEISAEPLFVGCAYLLPHKQDLSLYSVRLPIIGLNHRPIGEVQVEVLYIIPLANVDWKMDVSYQNHWKRREKTLDVGHRGMGSSYKRVTNVKENTIHSLSSAARNGANFVELDVLLTKDQVPVIYHDFSICLSTPYRESDDTHMVEMYVKELSLDQLRSMKVYHSSSVDEDLEITDNVGDVDHQPFPTLQMCLEQVDPHVGFNIEIKYPQLMVNGENENDNYFDLNPFLDEILGVVFKYAGQRKIIFSSFHADTCVMVNLKQNKYPVLFLSNGPTQRYLPYSDWRCNTFQHGISFAKAECLLGVNFQAEGLMQDLELVRYIQSLGLVLFVWGEDLNNELVKQTLRKMEVDAIIFDRMVCHHISRPFALHHMDQALHRRMIPDGCLRAYAQSFCAGEVLKCMRAYMSSIFTSIIGHQEAHRRESYVVNNASSDLQQHLIQRESLLLPEVDDQGSSL